MRETGKKDLLYERMKNDITYGNYPAGHRFPPEVDLAQRLGISRNTLRSALDKLEAENLIVRIKSRGTFVEPYLEKGMQKLKRLLVLSELNADLSFPRHYIIPGMIQEAMLRGYELENCNIGIFTNYTSAQIRDFVHNNEITGFVVIASGFTGNENIISTLSEQNVPIVLCHAYFKDYQLTNWPTIYYDIANGWEMAVRHLAEQGHRRIITTNTIIPDGSIRQWPRRQYLNLLRSLQIDDDESLIVSFNKSDHKSLAAPLYEIYRSSRKMPTAILCYSDFQAPIVYNVLSDLKLRVPQDVAVMGFSGAPDSKFMSPPLSTIDLDWINIGRKAIEIMDANSLWSDPERTGGKAPPIIRFPLHLRERESTRIKRFEYQFTKTGENLYDKHLSF